MHPVIRAAVVSTAVAAAAALSLPSPAQAAGPPPKAGLAGPQIVLQDVSQFSGVDIATTPDGTAYVGWIADAGDDNLRQVHLCVLPLGATACQGGVQTQPSMGPSTAEGLKVLVTPAGGVDLVWGYDKEPDAINGPRGARIGVAAVGPGGVLGAPTENADAPSHAELLDAEMSPAGAIWTVWSTSVAINSLEVRPGLGAAPVTVPTPYGASPAGLAFTGGTAILAIQQYGQISQPVSYATNTGAGWSGFTAVPRTWTAAANLGISASGHGVRIVASQDDAGYHPVISSLKGTTFAKPTALGDTNSCAPSSHDLGTDGSGRLVDVSLECSQIAIDNIADGSHAAITRFGFSGTAAGTSPQIATTPRGHGWVVWGVESTVGTRIGNKIVVAPILLPTLTTTRTVKSGSVSVTVKGPVSCVTPVSSAIGISTKASKGWKTSSKVLHLGSNKTSAKTINGATLTIGKTYTLKATAEFTKGTAHKTVNATLTFKACPNP